jgi:Ca2+-binding RTX toxin-like protein
MPPAGRVASGRRGQHDVRVNLTRTLASLTVPALVGAGLLLVADPTASTAAAPPKCKGRAVTILGTDGADTLKGSNQKDVILALGGDDRIDGRGGNDIICGGSGRDLIKGGPGHDKIFGGADGRSTQRNGDGIRLIVGDVVQGGPGDDLIDLGYDERQQTFGSAQRDRLSYKDSAFRVIVALGSPKGRGHAQGDGRDVLVQHPFLALLGSDKADLLTGSTYGDQILGRGGADHIDGLGGRDELVDGQIGAEIGDDVLVGGVGRDTLVSYGGRDKLSGDASADQLTLVHPPVGKVTVQGGPGADTLTVAGLRRGVCVNAVGGGGVDQLLPSVAPVARGARVDVDFKAGGFGVRFRDRVCGFVASVEDLMMDNPFTTPDGPRWHVVGTAADESVLLTGGASVFASMAGGDDRVTGSSGDDNLKGGPGDDRLFGGGGKDVANGGPGNDSCRKVEFRKGCEVPA